MLYKEKNEDSYVSVNNLISPRNKDEKIGVSFPLQVIHMESINSKDEAGPETKLFANEITEQESSMEIAQSDTSEVDGPRKKIVNGLTEKMDLGSGRRLDSSKKKEYSGMLVSTGYTIEEIIWNLEQLERLAFLYRQKTGNDTPVNELILQYIRRSKYNTGNWPLVAGKIDSSFVAFVDSHNTEFSNYFHENTIFHDPLTGNEVDFLHLIATLNGLIYEITWRDAGIRSLVGKAHINNLVGWAGDLQTLVIDVIKVTQNSNDYNVLYEAAASLMGGDPTVSVFSIMDLLADTDAWNIYKRLGTMSLPNAFRDYYLGGGIEKRYAEFTGNRDKEQIRRLSGEYTKDWFIWPIKWPLLRNISVTKTQSYAVRDAFTDFIWEKVIEERNRREVNLDDVPLPSLEDIDGWGAVLRNKPHMMTGEDVKELQTILKYFGYEVDVDGVFGPQTEEAVKELQKDSDLKVDGVVGYNTR